MLRSEMLRGCGFELLGDAGRGRGRLVECVCVSKGMW
jgi:hypothetical protein